MARRIKSRMRKYLGNRSHGAGNTKNRRGKGSRGGVGRAGFHKHKRMQYIKLEGTSTTEPGFINVTSRKELEVGLNQIAAQIGKGLHKSEGGAYSIDLTQKGKVVKLLGNGAFAYKANIKTNLFSGSAKEKVEKAGGTIVAAQ